MRRCLPEIRNGSSGRLTTRPARGSPPRPAHFCGSWKVSSCRSRLLPSPPAPPVSKGSGSFRISHASTVSRIVSILCTRRRFRTVGPWKGSRRDWKKRLSRWARRSAGRWILPVSRRPAGYPTRPAKSPTSATFCGSPARHWFAAAWPCTLPTSSLNSGAGKNSWRSRSNFSANSPTPASASATASGSKIPTASPGCTCRHSMTPSCWITWRPAARPPSSWKR